MSNFKPGNYSNILKWRAANPDWRKDNARKAAATKARKKQAKLDAMAKRRCDPADPLYDPSVYDVMRTIHADYGDWSWCNECAHDDLPRLLCYPSRRFINHSKPCLCKRFSPK